MKNRPPGPLSTTFSREELETMLAMMRDASQRFYFTAIRVGHHPFIEFTGLMNEYIKLCANALEQGIDFTQTSIHGSGVALPMRSFERDYLNEKLECIYGVSLDDLMQKKSQK